MKAKKHTFPEPGCSSCPHRQVVGNFPNETKYCAGFKRRKPRRFKNSDPKFKAPKWCPKRISPPICRVYGFKDTQSELMEFFWKMDRKKDGIKSISPSPTHYKVRAEVTLGMTAKRFFDSTQEEYLENILPEEVNAGEIIEIDDGLQPYYFYILDFATVVPLPYFRFSTP